MSMNDNENTDALTQAVLIHPMTPEGAVDLIHKLIRERHQARRAHEQEMAVFRNAWRVAGIDRDKYELQNAELLGRLNKLTRQLEQARSIAAALEAECARCWGPVHSNLIETIRQYGAFYSEGWDEDGA
jgi:hypothetical protein